MHVVLGATGHVGRAVAEVLLDQGEPVTVVVRDAAKAERLRDKGAAVAVADIRDTDALRAVFRRGRRAFLLNPPAAPDSNTDEEEAKTIRSILAALDGSGLEKVVAQSTYGARLGSKIGDLGTLFGLEEGLRAQAIPAVILRASYYMTNWDASLETALKEGVVHTLFPADFRLPMVAPDDLGRAAAGFMTEPVQRTGLRFVEGPERYTPADVAAAFGDVLGKPVKALETPHNAWKAMFKGMGFSQAAAESYAGMAAAAMEVALPPLDEVGRGSVTLHDHIAGLARG